MYTKIELEKFKIDCSRDDDQWVLTSDLQIMKVCYFVHTLDGKIFMYGYPLEKTKDYFDLPIHSSSLFIYSADSLVNKAAVLCPIQSIKCIMFKLQRQAKFIDDDDQKKNEYVFLPILSTLNC